MKTILCPTDFSKTSTNAIEYASAFSQQLKAHIILFHVYETPVIYNDIQLNVIQNAEEEIKALAQSKLKGLKSKLLKQYNGLTVETILLEGISSDQIVDLANRKNADMIIMGTTGNSKLARLLIGSTTSRVIEHANCPVLCIPKEKKYKGINKIVFATDLHEDNIGSAQTITSFARHFDAEIVFVYVDDEHLTHSDEKITEMTNKIRKKIKYPKLSGYISKDTNITKGLLYFLKNMNVDMLAMFTHKKHFPAIIFNQSLTKIMSHQTNIPLLVLKIPDRSII